MDERFHEALWGAIVGLFPADAHVVYANHNWMVIRWQRGHWGGRSNEDARSVVIMADEHVADTIAAAADYKIRRYVRNAERIISRRMTAYEDRESDPYQIRLNNELLEHS